MPITTFLFYLNLMLLYGVVVFWAGFPASRRNSDQTFKDFKRNFHLATSKATFSDS